MYCDCSTVFQILWSCNRRRKYTPRLRELVLALVVSSIVIFLILTASVSPPVNILFDSRNSFLNLTPKLRILYYYLYLFISVTLVEQIIRILKVFEVIILFNMYNDIDEPGRTGLEPSETKWMLFKLYVLYFIEIWICS